MCICAHQTLDYKSIPLPPGDYRHQQYHCNRKLGWGIDFSRPLVFKMSRWPYVCTFVAATDNGLPLPAQPVAIMRARASGTACAAAGTSERKGATGGSGVVQACRAAGRRTRRRARWQPETPRRRARTQALCTHRPAAATAAGHERGCGDLTTHLHGRVHIQRGCLDADGAATATPTASPPRSRAETTTASTPPAPTPSTPRAPASSRVTKYTRRNLLGPRRVLDLHPIALDSAAAACANVAFFTNQGGVREPLPPRSGRVRHEHRRHRRRRAAVRCRGHPDAVRGRVRVHGEQCCRSVAPSIIPPGIWRRITFGISRSVAMRGDVSGASKRPGSNHNAAAGSKYSNRILCAEARGAQHA
jgi:hypothetical protein